MLLLVAEGSGLELLHMVFLIRSSLNTLGSPLDYDNLDIFLQPINFTILLTKNSKWQRGGRKLVA